MNFFAQVFLKTNALILVIEVKNVILICERYYNFTRK